MTSRADELVSVQLASDLGVHRDVARQLVDVHRRAGQLRAVLKYVVFWVGFTLSVYGVAARSEWMMLVGGALVGWTVTGLFMLARRIPK